MTNGGGKSFYERIRDIDRRIIFLAIALAVVLPLLFNITFPEHPTPMVKGVYEAIDDLPSGSRVLMAFDYDPASAPELQPMATAWVRQCALKGHKMYFLALWPLGQQMAVNTIDEVLDTELRDLGYEEGIDYVNLGFKSGGQGVINVILTDFAKLYSTDVRGINVRDIPAMDGVRSLRSMDMIVNVSAGFPGLKEWVQFGSDPARIPIVGGSTAVQAPLLYPYYPNQLIGLLGGLRGAAEYETLLSDQYAQFSDTALNKGQVRMGAQAFAHLVIMAFIVIGNVTFFLDRRRSRG